MDNVDAAIPARLQPLADEQLAGLVAADREVFVTLYQRHVRDVYSYLARKCGRDAAEDLASDVFIRALEGIDRFDKHRSFRGWLFGIARNRAREATRQSARLRAGPLDDESRQISGDQSLTPENRLLEDEQSQIVARLLDSLGERDRELIELRYWAGLTHQEIAGITGSRSGTVRVAIHRIVRRLESQLRSDAQ